MAYTALIFFLWFSFWSAESGASLPWSGKWQKSFPFGSQIPELIVAVSIGIIAAVGWQEVFGFNFWVTVSIFIVSTAIAYAGKQSATWVYLDWEGHKNPDTDRISTLKSVNDWLASRLGYNLGDEGYSWVWAFTKGLITTLPLCGLGAVFQPLWREVASHAKGRLPYDPNMWMEIGDGFAYASAALVFLYLCSIF